MKRKLESRLAATPQSDHETDYDLNAWHFLSLPYVRQSPPNDEPSPPDSDFEEEGGTGIFHVVVDIREPWPLNSP